MSAWILPIGIYKLKLILAAHRMLLREIYGLFYLFWSLRMTHTTKVYFSEAGKDNPFFFFLHMWQVKGHDVYSYGSGLVADCLEKITFLPWTQMDYTYFFYAFWGVTVSQRAACTQNGLMQVPIYMGKCKEVCGVSAVLALQKRTCGRSIITCGALQAVHLNLSLPGTYALVK